MKTTSAILLLATPALFAGTKESVVTAPPPSSNGDWLTPIIDVRSRYEFGDVDGFDAAHAFTFRERVGLKTAAWNGFSALVEGEFTQAAVDDYNGGALGADPFDPTKTLIGDPETNELDQAYLQYEGFDTTVKLGRQTVIRDNAAFVGNVVWRQNQQTFDAVTFSNQSIDHLTVQYAYLNQVNKIFGSEADGATPNAQDIATSSHLVNLSYTGIKDLTLGAYAYIMNFQNPGFWDNNTFGLLAKKELFGIAFHGEIAWQDKAGTAGTEDALYAHGIATKTVGSHTISLGIEHLDAGFKTPLATLHAFNGYADVFIAGRANGNHNGLTDTYLSHCMPLFWDMKWLNSLHLMGDNQISAGYGWEYDSVLTKKFNDHFTAIAKLGWFNEEGDSFVSPTPAPNATRFSVEMNYVF